MAEKLLDESGLAIVRDWARSQFAGVTHNHSANNITSGTLNVSRIPVGTGISVADGDVSVDAQWLNEKIATGGSSHELYQHWTLFEIVRADWSIFPRYHYHQLHQLRPPYCYRYYCEKEIPYFASEGVGFRGLPGDNYNENTHYLGNWYNVVIRQNHAYIQFFANYLPPVTIFISGNLYPETDGGEGRLWESEQVTLWTNAAPTSAFAAQKIDLSPLRSLEEFDYIQVIPRFSTSDNVIQSDGLGLFPTWNKAGPQPEMAIHGTTANRTGGRGFYAFDREIWFDAGRYNGSTSANSYAIPYKVNGISFGHGVGTKVEGVSRLLTLIGKPELRHSDSTQIQIMQASTMANGNNPEFEGWNEDEQCFELRTTQSSNSYTYLTSRESFDVTQYKWLIVRCYFRGYATNSNLIGLLDHIPTTGSAGTEFAASVKAVNSTTATTTFAFLDISGLSGLYHLGLETAGSSGNYKGVGRIYRAWLSKN